MLILTGLFWSSSALSRPKFLASNCFFSSIGNTSYLIKTNKNWTDAQSHCRQYYTDMPTIHNSSENDYISNMLDSGWNVWIGLFLDSWEWSDKWILFFRHWVAGQPSMNSGSGDCVGMSRMNSGRWAQYSCDLQTAALFSHLCVSMVSPLSLS
uniref:C-type lectin domain-containing protein n=1 Tax=Cyprinus carpio TaxID=7962 RepID=A0A8C1J106_CYPCA